MASPLIQPVYRVMRMNLTNIRPVPGEQIAALGELVESIIPLDVAPGNGCTIRFGNNGDDIPLDQTPPLSVCAGNGVFFANSVAAPGTIAVFLVGFADIQAAT